MRLCAISVDLDEIPNYHAIHGLAQPSGSEATLVYDLALDRLDDFARAHDLPLTLFAIGADLARPSAARALRALAARGHEVASHSLDHLYDLTRRPRVEQQAQIEGALDAIQAATGTRPVGFRAPGYTVTDDLLDVVRESGARYDSSVFPCPPYYAAKAAKLAALRALGRRSESILDTPQVLLAPTRPYRLGRPYWKRGSGMVELPIAVTRGPRLPFIGTTLALAGPGRSRWLARGVLGEPLVNLELHGLDALGTEDGLHDLTAHQPDARVAAHRKLSALAEVVGVLRAGGYAFVTLREAAERVA